MLRRRKEAAEHASQVLPDRGPRRKTCRDDVGSFDVVTIGGRYIGWIAKLRLLVSIAGGA